MWSGSRNAGVLLLLLLVLSQPIYSEGVNLTMDEYDEIMTLSTELQTELRIAKSQLEEQKATLTGQLETIQQLRTQLTTVDTRLDESRISFDRLRNDRNSLELWNNILIGTTVASLITTGLVIWLK